MSDRHSGGGGVGSCIATAACLYSAYVVSSDSRAEAIVVGTSAEDKYSVYFLYATDGDPSVIVYVGRVKTENFSSRMA